MPRPASEVETARLEARIMVHHQIGRMAGQVVQRRQQVGQGTPVR